MNPFRYSVNTYYPDLCEHDMILSLLYHVTVNENVPLEYISCDVACRNGEANTNHALLVTKTHTFNVVHIRQAHAAASNRLGIYRQNDRTEIRHQPLIIEGCENCKLKPKPAFTYVQFAVLMRLFWFSLHCLDDGTETLLMR